MKSSLKLGNKLPLRSRPLRPSADLEPTPLVQQILQEYLGRWAHSIESMLSLLPLSKSFKMERRLIIPISVDGYSRQVRLSLSNYPVEYFKSKPKPKRSTKTSPSNATSRRAQGRK